MTSSDDMTPADDELMAALAEAVAESGAVPDRRREDARAAFTWRTVEAELAELLHDSALDAGAAVRSSADSARALAFGHGGLALELEIAGGLVLGQVVPDGGAVAGPATVTVQRTGDADREATADGAGFFRIEGVAGGPVRFVVRQGDLVLTTPWVAL